MRIKPVNPVAKAVAQNRRRTATQVAQPKKVAKKAKKHDDSWKQKRKALRRAKQILQEITHA